MLRDDALCDFGEAADGDISEIETGELILLEAAIEAAAALVTGVGAGDREAPRESGFSSCPARADWRLHGAVEASTALQKKASVPVLRQYDGEAYTVGRACSRPARSQSLCRNAIAALLDKRGGSKE